MQQQEDSSFPRRDGSVVGPLSEFLRSQAGVEAILFDHERKSLALATLGEVDPQELQRRLQATLRILERGYEATPVPEGVLVRHLPGQTLLEKVSCPTAPLFWQWRAFDWPAPEAPPEEGEEWKALSWLAGGCGVALVAAFVSSRVTAIPEPVSIAFYLVALVLGGWDAARDAWGKLPKGDLDIHFLMLAVAAGAISIGAWAEGALLLFLFSASGAIEHFALHRTYREIRALQATAPRMAHQLLPDGETRECEITRLRPGDRLLVRPDEVFPVDVEIRSGETAADESTLSGEATPVPKTTGDTAWAGTLNLWGVVTVEVLRPVQESALQKIIDLIRNAERLRAPSQRFTDRFGKPYTFAILGLVSAMFLVWWLGFGLPVFFNTAETTSAFYRAMTLLVVASPCALVISIPSAILSAIAWGARKGILFRGGAAIEKLGEIDVVALDKTGTLTTGELAVAGVESFPAGREREVLEIAYALESNSHHPIARAITAHGRRLELRPREVRRFQSLTGKGLRAEVDERVTFLGRRELMAVGELEGVLAPIPEPDLAQTEVWVLHEGLLGRILLQDVVRKESRAVLAELAARGIRTIMLTGDRRAAAEKVAREIGIAEVRAGLHPEEKVAIVHELTREGHRVAMVGDGVNDAPSLAAAHVSVAMGGRGSDAALEQSDVVLMHDRIERLLTALKASVAARRVIRQNLVLSVGTVVVMAAASLFGVVPLTFGVIVHEGSTLLVCLNSLRLLFRKG